MSLRRSWSEYLMSLRVRAVSKSRFVSSRTSSRRNVDRQASTVEPTMPTTPIPNRNVGECFCAIRTCCPICRPSTFGTSFIFAPLEQPTLIGMNIRLLFEMWLGLFKPVINRDYLIVGHAVDFFAPCGVWVYALDVSSFFFRVLLKNSFSCRSRN